MPEHDLVEQTAPLEAGIDAQSLHEAAGTFAWIIGFGWDQLHPRAVCRCPPAALQALARILIWAEVLQQRPAKVGVLLVRLIPKAGGVGLRPIGLQLCIVRWWSRVRLALMRAWQSEHEHDFFYAGPGKGADVASWKQAARLEHARAVPGHEHATVLLDMVR